VSPKMFSPIDWKLMLMLKTIRSNDHYGQVSKLMNDFDDKHCMINVCHYANMFTNKFLSIQSPFFKSKIETSDWPPGNAFRSQFVCSQLIFNHSLLEQQRWENFFDWRERERKTKIRWEVFRARQLSTEKKLSFFSAVKRFYLCPRP
jgi:hypothetical protein